MRELGIEEAGTQLVALVEQGEEILLMRDGRVVGELVPPRTVRERARIDQAFAEMRERVKQESVQSLDAATLKEWISEGRR